MYRYADLEKKIHIKFKNQDLINNVFIHKSFLNECKDDKIHSNERMEFLGDAVLELVVTEYLYRNYENPEGELTNWRSALVKGKNLASLSRELNLGSYLFLSKGEEKSGGREKNYILANTYEALIGGIYIDQGYEISKKFILEFVLRYLGEILEKKLHIDAKSLFQEKSQEILNITPDYKVLKEEGPDHKKLFTMGAYIEEDIIGKGQGNSKQTAEQAAAVDALKAKGWDKDLPLSE